MRHRPDGPSPRRRFVLAAVALSLVMALAACGSDSDGADAAASQTTESVDQNGDGTGGGGASDWVEPDYDGLPEDLTSEEVCALLDEETIAEHLGSEVSATRPGSGQPDCTWTYKLQGGPATTLQVQVMSMDQTDERLGTEALEWALDFAAGDTEIVEIDALEVPNGSYEFGASTVVFAIDPSGRIFTVAAHSDSPEEGRIAVVEEVLNALAEQHA